MKLIFEKINKNVFLIALVLLFYRVGNFAYSFIPKPYEVLFSVLVILTIIYLLWNKKVKEFFFSIEKNIRIAVIVLISSILLGWLIAIYIKHIPTTFNMILEFGTFSIGLISFLLILFYTRNDKEYVKRYFYALLVPIIYIICIVLPNIAARFQLVTNGNFNGFTPNVNIVSKILLVPAVFFLAKALFEKESTWLKILYMFLSAALATLLFWTASRGALLSYGLGILVVLLLYIKESFSWKKLFVSTGIALAVMLLGFLMTPYSGKQVALDRVLNSDGYQQTYAQIQNKSIFSIIKSATSRNTNDIGMNAVAPDVPSETRLQIWPFYIKYILKNPLGIGPDTHLDSHIPSRFGGYLNTGTHNTYLQIWLWGGLLGIISFVYIFYRAFKNLKNALQNNYGVIAVALMGVLTTLTIAIVFDDSLSLYWLWVVLALALTL